MPSVPKIPWSHPLITCIQHHTRILQIKPNGYGSSASWLEVHSPGLNHIFALPSNKSLTILLAHGSVTKLNKQIRPKLINFVCEHLDTQKGQTSTLKMYGVYFNKLGFWNWGYCILIQGIWITCRSYHNSPYWVCFWNLTMWEYSRWSCYLFGNVYKRYSIR